MKANQRTVKIYDSTHKILSRLSTRFGVSMSALVDIITHNAKDMETLQIGPRDRRSVKSNARTALKV